MNVLVIGSGGREHAICHSFAKSSRVERLYCADGNAGIGQIAECVDIKPTEIERLSEFAEANGIDLTFVGGEAPLALGIVDTFEARGLTIVGPRKQAAMLEASKAFAKDFMAAHGVPTAKYITAHSPQFARLELESGNLGTADTPIVVKADGLAAGKGVVVAPNREEALRAIDEMSELAGEDAASKIVLEECIVGREVSLLMFANGEHYSLMPATRDHKRVGEGDTGPNTGGMGTITDDSLLSGEDMQAIRASIIEPTLRGCVRGGFPFCGILFLGLMMTPAGPKLLEYNVRFGDPETQAILVRLETDLVDICEAMLQGRLSELEVKWRRGFSACVVLASHGYPVSPRVGDIISGLENAASVPGVTVFHAGTMLSEEGDLITAGGRVLGITAAGDDKAGVLKTAYEAASQISFEGMQFRKDIGA